MAPSAQPTTKGPAFALWPFVQRVLGFAAVITLFAMMGLTSADVIARYVFNRPIPGAFELTEMFLVTLIFLALPLATFKGEHVQVELYDPKPGSPGYHLTLWLGVALVCGVLAFTTLELWDHAGKLQRRNTVTNSLDLPYYPLAYLTAIASAISGVAMVLYGLSKARHGQPPGAPDSPGGSAQTSSSNSPASTRP